MNTPTRGQNTLIFGDLIALDEQGAAGCEWSMPREKYFNFGDNNQATFTFEYYGAGPAIDVDNVELYVQRTASYGSDPEFFEDMNRAAIALSMGHYWVTYRFGRDRVADDDHPPLGIGRIRLVNPTVSVDSPAFIRLRVWVTLQRF